MKPILLALSLFATILFSGRVDAPDWSQFSPRSEIRDDHANGDVDTLVLTRPAGLSGLAFSIYTTDSTDITSAIVRRIIKDKFLAVQAGDTLLTADSSASGVRLKTVPLTPLPDAYAVIVTYDNDGGGVQSGNDTLAVYTFHKQFGAR